MTMITPSYLGETIEYSSLHACRSTLEDPTETKRQFTLPEDRPALVAGVIPEDPGMVVSPFAPDQPFQISPEEWSPGQAIVCLRSRQPLVLPASLPEWNPTGTVKEGQPGTVFSPFGRKLAMKVAGPDWAPGATVVCTHSSHAFVLPQELPPMVGSVSAGVVGKGISPYAPGCEVQVLQKQWVPNGKVICTQTGRPFLLPSMLPVWEKKTFPWALVAAPVVLLLLAGAIFFTPLKDVLFKKSGPASPPSDGPTSAGPSGTDTHSTGKMEWPHKYVFLQGVSPDPKLGAITLTAGSVEKPVSFARAEGDASEISVDLAEALKEKNFSDAPELTLKITVPGYEPKLVSLKKTSSGEASNSDPVVLRRARLKVRITGLLNHPFYNSVRLEMIDNALHKPDEEERSFALAGGSTDEVKTGKYKVTLFRDPSKASGADAALRVADKTLYSEKDFTPNGDNVIKVPEVAIPQDLAGYTRLEMSAPYYVARDKAGGDIAVNGSPHEATMNEWTSSILRFDNSFTKGVLIEESSLTRDYMLLTLDVLAFAIYSDHLKGEKYGTGPGDDKIKTELNRFVASLAPPNGDIHEIDAAAVIQSRMALFDSAKSILAAVPAHPNNWRNFAVLDIARKNCQWFLSLPLDDKQGPKWDAWKRTLAAGLGSRDRVVNEADLQTLTEKVTFEGQKAEGLFVAQPFVVTAVDAAGAMTVKIDSFLPNVEKPGTAMALAPTQATVKSQGPEGSYVLVRELKGSETKSEYITTPLTGVKVAKP